METKKTKVAEMAMITMAKQFSLATPLPGWLVISQPGSGRCKCPKSKQVEAVVNVAANGAVDLVSLLARALVPPAETPRYTIFTPPGTGGPGYLLAC